MSLDRHYLDYYLAVAFLYICIMAGITILFVLKNIVKDLNFVFRLGLHIIILQQPCLVTCQDFAQIPIIFLIKHFQSLSTPLVFGQLCATRDNKVFHMQMILPVSLRLRFTQLVIHNSPVFIKHFPYISNIFFKCSSTSNMKFLFEIPCNT